MLNAISLIVRLLIALESEQNQNLQEKIYVRIAQIKHIFIAFSPMPSIPFIQISDKLIAD